MAINKGEFNAGLESERRVLWGFRPGGGWAFFRLTRGLARVTESVPSTQPLMHWWWGALHRVRGHTNAMAASVLRWRCGRLSS